LPLLALMMALVLLYACTNAAAQNRNASTAEVSNKQLTGLDLSDAEENMSEQGTGGIKETAETKNETASNIASPIITVSRDTPSPSSTETNASGDTHTHTTKSPAKDNTSEPTTSGTTTTAAPKKTTIPFTVNYSSGGGYGSSVYPFEPKTGLVFSFEEWEQIGNERDFTKKTFEKYGKSYFKDSVLLLYYFAEGRSGIFNCIDDVNKQGETLFVHKTRFIAPVGATMVIYSCYIIEMKKADIIGITDVKVISTDVNCSFEEFQKLEEREELKEAKELLDKIRGGLQ